MGPSYVDFLRERRLELEARVADACARAGRDASEVEVVAVSKTVEPEGLLAAVEAGYGRFGENRPQELVRKTTALEQAGLAESVRMDMIGNLQRNKINQVLGRAQLIHSISSAHLAEGVSSRAEARGLRQQVLLEVNVSGEASKSGFSPADATRAFEGLLALGGIEVVGLMTMAPAHDPDAARRTFCGLRELRDGLERRGGRLPVLSCGMSDDFELAVEEGSTLVRLGRVVFDQGYTLD